MHRNKLLVAGLGIMLMAFLIACGGDSSAFECPEGPRQEECKGIVRDYENGPDDPNRLAEAASRIAALGSTPVTSTAQPSPGTPGVTLNDSGKDGNGPLVATNLLDGRSQNPRTVAGKIPGTDCAVYNDTGIGLTESYKCSIPEGWTVLVFGVHILNNETDEGWDNGGFWAFVGPTTMDVTVVDGAYSAKTSGDAAYQDYCVRYEQHLQNGWLATNANLPAGWDAKCDGQ